MCLIIVKPSGEQIPFDAIESAMHYNPDGTGLMAAEYEHLVGRWLDIKPDTLHGKVNNIAGDAAVHFRWATHGKVSLKNVHPFRVTKNSFLMHNGILSDYARELTKAHDISDTRHFVESFCRPMIKERGFLPLDDLEAEIGGDPVAMLHPNGDITRHGHGWSEHNGCFFSNEYAWSAPYSYRSKSLWAGKVSKTRSFSLDDLASDILGELDWELPLNNSTYISSADSDIFEDLWSDPYYDLADFLIDCSPETKLRLLMWAHDYGHIDC